MMYTSKWRGNALPEYVLIAGLVAVVSVGVLTIMGGNFNDVLAALKTDLVGNSSTLAGGGDGAGGGGDGAGGTGSNSAVRIPLSDGGYLDVDVSPQFKNWVETTGVNGTTLLTAVIRERLNKKEQAGKLTPEQADLFFTLSNQGHGIGEIQALLESYAGTTIDNDEFLNQTVNYRGQEYTMSELAEMLDSGETNEKSITKLYENMSDQLSQNLTDEQMKTLLNELNKQILAGANSYGKMVSQVAQGQNDTKTLAGSTTSTTTHDLASSICIMGDNDSDGLQCYDT